MTRDPMGFSAGDSNLYRYVNNRPTFETDPSGLQDRWENDPRVFDQNYYGPSRSQQMTSVTNYSRPAFSSGSTATTQAKTSYPYSTVWEDPEWLRERRERQIKELAVVPRES